MMLSPTRPTPTTMTPHTTTTTTTTTTSSSSYLPSSESFTLHTDPSVHTTKLFSPTESTSSSSLSITHYNAIDSDPLLFNTLNSTLLETKTWLQGLYTSPSVFTMGGLIHQLNVYQEEAHPRIPTSTSSSSESFLFTTQDLLNQDLNYYEHSEWTMLSDATELQKVLEQCRFVLTEIYAKREALLKLSGEVWRTNSSQIKDLENALRKSTQEEMDLNQELADLESQLLDVAKTIEHKEKSILDRLDRLSLLSKQANLYSKNDPTALADLQSHLTQLSNTCELETQTLHSLESMLSQLTQESCDLDDLLHHQSTLQARLQSQVEDLTQAWVQKQTDFQQRNLMEQTVIKNQYFALKAIHQLHGIQQFQSFPTHFTIQFHSGVKVVYDAEGLHLNDWILNEHTMLVHVFHSFYFHPPKLPACQFDETLKCWVKWIGSSFQLQLYMKEGEFMESMDPPGSRMTQNRYSKVKDRTLHETTLLENERRNGTDLQRRKSSSLHKRNEVSDALNTEETIDAMEEGHQSDVLHLKKITVNYLGMSESIRQQLVQYLQQHCSTTPSTQFLFSLCQFLESLDSTMSTSSAIVPPPSSSSSSSSSSSHSSSTSHPPHSSYLSSLTSFSSPIVSSFSGEELYEELKESKEKEKEEKDEGRRKGDMILT